MSTWANPYSHVFVTGEIMSAANFKTYVTDDLVALRNGLGVSLTATSVVSYPEVTWNTISFAAEEVDNAAMHSTGSRITIPVTGNWHLSAAASWEQNDNGTVRAWRILQNGTTDICRDMRSPVLSHPAATTLGRDKILGVGDYLELQGYQNCGGNMNVEWTAYSPWLMASFIGEMG